jgi:hypothetical protein
MVLTLGHFGKQIKNTWEVLKCGWRERSGRSIGPIVIKWNQGEEEYLTNKTQE